MISRFISVCGAAILMCLTVPAAHADQLPRIDLSLTLGDKTAHPATFFGGKVNEYAHDEETGALTIPEVKAVDLASRTPIVHRRVPGPTHDLHIFQSDTRCLSLEMPHGMVPDITTQREGADSTSLIIGSHHKSCVFLVCTTFPNKMFDLNNKCRVDCPGCSCTQCRDYYCPPPQPPPAPGSDQPVEIQTSQAG